ncbi:MAG: leucine-rich repeat protein [Lachnospiraceae bacterium]|nr:leucine-rich repeat protein [Lachnospiraceae bacterium]
MIQWISKVKKTTALALATILLGNSAAISAADTEAVGQSNMQKVQEYSGEECVVSDAYMYEQEELFAGYVERAFYGNLGVSFYGISAREELSVPSQILYDYLKEKIESVAKGEISSTVFSVSKQRMERWEKNGVQIRWTAEDLGVDSLWDSGSISAEAMTAFKSKAWGQFEFSKVLDALMHDCPYDMYWFNKLVGASSNYSISLSGDELILGDMNLSFAVADAYKLSEDTSGLTADTAKTAATTTAAANAQAIAEKYADLSDEDKLKAYRDEICALVSYNDDAASSNYNGGYGDPWQLIYVFDGDSNTNVVCEGYAKAFQYLCDMSSFTSNRISCYSVSGVMSGGTGAGGHMWNIVTMKNAKNYLVDITNSDEGTIGQDGGLFLSGVDGSVEEGYTFTIYNQDIRFTYADDIVELWGNDGILVLADKDYDSSDAEVAKTDISLAEITVDGCTYSGLELEPAITVVLDGVELKKDKDYSIVAYENNIHAGDNASVTIEAVKNSEYIGSVTKMFTISPKAVNSPVIEGIESSYLYTGNAIEPAVIVKDEDTVLSENEYTVSYSNHVNAGTATLTIADREGGDYLVGGFDLEYTINKAVPVIAEVPVAEAITVGELLSASVLKGGSAVHGEKAVEGSFAWKDASVKPMESDSNMTAYTVVFTPVDIRNYEPVEISVMLTINPMKDNTGNSSGNASENLPENKPVEDAPNTGTIFTDSKNQASYKIIKSGFTGGCVEYINPVNKNAKKVIIPATVTLNGITYKVTSIAKNAFKNNKKVTQITIEKNIEKIGANAFYGCKKLKNITIKTKKLTAKTIGKNAFKNTYKKATVKVPKAKWNVYKSLLKKKGIGKNAKIKK